MSERAAASSSLFDRLGGNAMDVGVTVEKLPEENVREQYLALGGVDLASAAGNHMFLVRIFRSWAVHAIEIDIPVGLLLRPDRLRLFRGTELKVIFFPGLGCDQTSLELVADRIAVQHQVHIWKQPTAASSFRIWQDGLNFGTHDGTNPALEYESDILLVGHSMGSMLALKAASLYPEKLVGLILFEGNLLSEDCGLFSKRLAAFTTKREVSMFVKEHANHSDPMLRYWADMASQFDPMTLIQYARDLVQASTDGSLLEAFNRLSCPKLLVHGNDYLGRTTLDIVGSNNRFHLEGAGHFAVLENPATCADVILQIARG